LCKNRKEILLITFLGNIYLKIKFSLCNKKEIFAL